MESHYPNTTYNYGDGQAPSSQYPYGAPPPSSYSSLPNLRTPYEQQQQQQPQGQQHQQQQQTLPPLHPQRTPGSSSQLYEHYNNSRTSQAPYPSAATSQLNNNYSSNNQFGGSFANYSHDALIPQQHQGYIQHDSSAPAYMSSSGFGQTLPPLPSTQPYGQPYSGAYDQPSHVVGAQGRRGILPSDDGRPPAVAPDGTGAPRTNVMPVKDQDGKFPCPHCTKTYLHAKHLKRHLLRHTGDRPYSCFLCNDTFSRSDILKRHFQKCSIRRGNPTGASHLQNSQSHLRKQAAKRTSNDLGGKPGSSHDGTKSQPDSETNSLYSTSTISRPASDNFSSLRSDGRTDSSISTMSTPVREKARSMNGPQSLASIKAEPASSQPVTPALPTGSTAMSEAPYSARDAASNVYSQRDTTPSTYRDVNRMNSMAAAAHNGQEFEWNGLHAQQGQPGVDFVHPYFNVGGTEQDLMGAENNYNPWQFPHQNAVSFHDLSLRLTSYLQLDARQDVDAHVVRSVLSPENVEHFLTKYLNFHQHWPNLHMPTFHPLTSYTGLTLAMCTVGAAYSERVDISDVRVLLRTVKPHIYSVSDAGRAAANPVLDVTALNDVPDILEQIAALGILMKMVLWHSEPEHRVVLNTDHGNICALVKRMGMLEPVSRMAPGFSELHQPNSQVNMVTATNFDYTAWLRQEKRLRTLYIIVQADMGQSLYFNMQPNFTVDEIKLPLPADDAAWEAGNAQDCATALGLHGRVMQEAINVTGSRRAKQIEFHLAMKVLAHNDYGFQPRSTNAYGKFMLVHGIHIQLWFLQHQQRMSLNSDFFSSMGSSPLPPLDWIANNGVIAPGGSTSSGQATPISESGPGGAQLLERELFKWRKHWDEDDALEYPPNTAQPRVGFCRDAKPFYWLGRMLLKNLHQMDPNAPWQKRFATMMRALKQSKGMSQNEPGPAGLGLIMTADTIDPQYGVDELTLDMKLLFSPISPAESPSVQPGNFAPMGP